MTKWIYSFEGDKHCLRCPLSFSDGIYGELCGALKQSCNGDLTNRPEFCPLQATEAKFRISKHELEAIQDWQRSKKDILSLQE